jgi:acyl-CoA dehydrogenase
VVITTRYDDAAILILAPLQDSLLTPGSNLVGDPRDTILFHSQPVYVDVIPNHLGPDVTRMLGASMRAAQMSGAIERIMQQSISYAGERQQFGRAIGSFQAVQHMLAQLAEESAAATVAANHAFVALDQQRDLEFAAAIAKIRTGDAAGSVIALSHQVHGAIGFAHEYLLHHLTRRLMAWRVEFGTEADWAQRLAARAVPLAGTGLWSFVTSAQSDGSQKEFSYE